MFVDDQRTPTRATAFRRSYTPRQTKDLRNPVLTTAGGSRLSSKKPVVAEDLHGDPARPTLKSPGAEVRAGLHRIGNQMIPQPIPHQSDFTEESSAGGDSLQSSPKTSDARSLKPTGERVSAHMNRCISNNRFLTAPDMVTKNITKFASSPPEMVTPRLEASEKIFATHAAKKVAQDKRTASARAQRIAAEERAKAALKRRQEAEQHAARLVGRSPSETPSAPRSPGPSSPKSSRSALPRQVVAAETELNGSSKLEWVEEWRQKVNAGEQGMEEEEHRSFMMQAEKVISALEEKVNAAQSRQTTPPADANDPFQKAAAWVEVARLAQVASPTLTMEERWVNAMKAAEGHIDVDSDAQSQWVAVAENKDESSVAGTPGAGTDKQQLANEQHIEKDDLAAAHTAVAAARAVEELFIPASDQQDEAAQAIAQAAQDACTVHLHEGAEEQEATEAVAKEAEEQREIQRMEEEQRMIENAATENEAELWAFDKVEERRLAAEAAAQAARESCMAVHLHEGAEEQVATEAVAKEAEEQREIQRMEEEQRMTGNAATENEAELWAFDKVEERRLAAEAAAQAARESCMAVLDKLTQEGIAADAAAKESKEQSTRQTTEEQQLVQNSAAQSNDEACTADLNKVEEESVVAEATAKEAEEAYRAALNKVKQTIEEQQMVENNAAQANREACTADLHEVEEEACNAVLNQVTEEGMTTDATAKESNLQSASQTMEEHQLVENRAAQVSKEACTAHLNRVEEQLVVAEPAAKQDEEKVTIQQLEEEKRVVKEHSSTEVVREAAEEPRSPPKKRELQQHLAMETTAKASEAQRARLIRTEEQLRTAEVAAKEATQRREEVATEIAAKSAEDVGQGSAAEHAAVANSREEHAAAESGKIALASKSTATHTPPKRSRSKAFERIQKAKQAKQQLEDERNKQENNFMDVVPGRGYSIGFVHEAAVAAPTPPPYPVASTPIQTPSYSPMDAPASLDPAPTWPVSIPRLSKSPAPEAFAARDLAFGTTKSVPNSRGVEANRPIEMLKKAELMNELSQVSDMPRAALEKCSVERLRLLLREIREPHAKAMFPEPTKTRGFTPAHKVADLAVCTPAHNVANLAYKFEQGLTESSAVSPQEPQNSFNSRTRSLDSFSPRRFRSASQECNLVERHLKKSELVSALAQESDMPRAALERCSLQRVRLLLQKARENSQTRRKESKPACEDTFEAPLREMFSNSAEDGSPQADIASNGPEVRLREAFSTCAADGSLQADKGASVKPEESVEPKEMRYFVENTELRRTTDGLNYRRSKQVHDKLYTTVFSRDVAPWGTFVAGIDEGDGWIRVGDLFLPKTLGAQTVLTPAHEVKDVEPAELLQRVEKTYDQPKTLAATSVGKRAVEPAELFREAEKTCEQSPADQSKTLADTLKQTRKAERSEWMQATEKFYGSPRSLSVGSRMTKFKYYLEKEERATDIIGASAFESNSSTLQKRNAAPASKPGVRDESPDDDHMNVLDLSLVLS